MPSYLTFALTTSHNLGFVPSLVLAVIGTIGLMFGLDRLVYSRVRQKSEHSWHTLIISLAFYIVLENIISLVWGDSMLSIRPWEVQEGREILGLIYTKSQLISILIAILFILGYVLILNKSYVGKQLVGVMSNSELGEVFGIDKNTFTAISVLMGSTILSVVGLLIGIEEDMSPRMGFAWLISGIVAMIIGGVARTNSLILGAFILVVIQHLTGYLFDGYWSDAVTYILLTLLLFFRPYGLGGEKLRKMEI